MRRSGLGPKLLWAALILTASGCGFDPEGDQPLDPPAIYREWFAKTEACSGRKGHLLPDPHGGAIDRDNPCRGVAGVGIAVVAQQSAGGILLIASLLEQRICHGADGDRGGDAGARRATQ